MGIPSAELLHAGQSQRTDLIGAKPLGIVCAWINRHSLRRDEDVPEPDVAFSDLRPLLELVDLSHPPTA
jgi:FMN phosphatase YigB (HAD superfamily)